MKKEEIEKIFKLNDIKNYHFHELPHGTGTSVDDHISALRLKYHDGCSTLIFKTDNAFKALLRRDDTHIDNKKLKKVFGTKNLRIASPEELKSETGFEVGMVSPLRLKMETFIDMKVIERPSVRIGTGANEFSLEIGTHELKKITNAKIVDVSFLNPQKAEMKILSGITPSSSKGLHLGNYLGAVKSHVEFQQKGECFYFIADYHALNTVFDAKALRKNIFETYLDYLALGIDVEKTTFFIESHVTTIFELTEILNNVVSFSEMQRMHAFKDKLADANSGVDSINMGLFTYPILMAADILLFEPDIIPVGEDQSQHVEIARDIAKSFNNRYGQVLKVPDLFIKKEAARVVGTDGERKMSKSLGNDITLFANEDTIKKQIMGAKTDPNRIHKNDPGDPEKNVIFSYMKLMDFDETKRIEFEERYKSGNIGDVEIKDAFFQHFLEYFRPFREKRNELSQNNDYVVNLIKKNAQKANTVANRTIEKVRESIGAFVL